MMKCNSALIVEDRVVYISLLSSISFVCGHTFPSWCAFTAAERCQTGDWAGPGSGPGLGTATQFAGMNISALWDTLVDAICRPPRCGTERQGRVSRAAPSKRRMLYLESTPAHFGAWGH